jgi:hypothetical protein
VLPLLAELVTGGVTSTELADHRKKAMGHSIAERLVALVNISLVPRPERVKDEIPRLDPADRALRQQPATAAAPVRIRVLIFVSREKRVRRSGRSTNTAARSARAHRAEWSGG